MCWNDRLFITAALGDDPLGVCRFTGTPISRDLSASYSSLTDLPAGRDLYDLTVYMDQVHLKRLTIPVPTRADCFS